MNGTHPTAAQLDRYRRRTASPAELLESDTHIASCDRCFEAVRADAHLTFDQMVAYTARGEERALVERHIALCEMCRGEVNDLLHLREVMRPARRRVPWLAAAAAILAFALLAVWVYRRDAPQDAPPVVQTAQTAPASPAAPPREIALKKPEIVGALIPEPRVLRGGAPSARPFALHAPVATVVLDDRPRFAWAATTNAQSYDVVVADLESSAVAATGESVTATWRPEKPLPRGRTYAWQVTAHTGSESVVSPGQTAPEARFHVASAAAVTAVEAQTTPLDRAVALAEHGALDDAERELQRAADGGETRAAPLLEQVRAWRPGTP